MNSKIYVVFIIVSLLLAGCGGKASTQPKETAPEHELKCNINTQEFAFKITGETGEVEITFNNESDIYNTDSSGVITGVTTTVNRDLLFTSSQHKYHIEGTITVNETTNEVTYDITATGDTFGDTPQTCKKP